MFTVGLVHNRACGIDGEEIINWDLSRRMLLPLQKEYMNSIIFFWKDYIESLIKITNGKGKERNQWEKKMKENFIFITLENFILFQSDN